MENQIQNVDAAEVIDSNITDQKIRCRNKNRFDENTIVDYLCKSYPDCNVRTIRQRIAYLENKNKILNKPHNGKNSYYLIDDSVITPDDSASPDDPQSIPLFELETPKVNHVREQVTLIQELNGKLLSLSFVLEQVFVIKKTIQDIQERRNNKETYGYVKSLTDQINFLKAENKTKNTIIQILSENQSYFSKQSEKQEFIIPKQVSQEKIKSNSKI